MLLAAWRPRKEKIVKKSYQRAAVFGVRKIWKVFKPLLEWCADHPNEKRDRALSRLAAWIVTAIAHIVFRLQVEGQGNLPTHGPFVIIANHSSDLDPWMLVAAANRNPDEITIGGAVERFLQNKALAYLFGNILHVIPIDRTNGFASYRSCLETLKQKRILILFPEGGRSANGEIGPFTNGTAGLAHHGYAVIPAYIDGAFSAMPKGAAFPRLLTPISVRFGKPINSNGETKEELAAFMRLAVIGLKEGEL